MNRRGAALLVTLWLLVALAGVASVALAGVRTGVGASRNRIEFIQAGWAAEACLEIQRRWAVTHPGPLADRLTRGLDSVDLGERRWCRLQLEDPAARLQVNLASPAALHAVLQDSAAVERLLAARPLPALAALALHHGWDSARVAGLDAVLTVRGAGFLNLNVASPTVLLGLPGMDAEGADLLVRRRTSRPFANLDDALAALPPRTRQRVLARYPEFVASAMVESRVFVSRAEGHVGASPLTARLTATVVWAGDRLAVVAREVE